ncbi:type VI secretion system protein [Azospirillum brasilense]|uniref:type VI secretion system protein n=1 Tax=Azospirillum brasilense TaxID=192 RepID=UPI001FFE3510|nr:type VI secretion system protein [Azospirillum brasilense]
MVLLMLTLELVLSTIGSAIVTLLSFAVTLAPYALLALPLYIFYRLGRMVWPKLRGWRRKPAAKAAGRKAPVRRAAPPAPLRVRAEAPPPTKAAANTPPNARIYGEGLDILTRQMRGPLRRGDIPWFLAFGVGGPALLATDPTHVRWPEDGNGENGCWWFCEGAAILHAGADSADGSRLGASWPALVAAMRKRPMRRPLDGVLLMVGADELRAAAERPAKHHGPRDALAKRGAALRERLRSLRDELGVVGPVHVVVVRAEALDGFTDLCAAMPSALLDGVLGWTNPQDWAKPFEPRRIDEAFEAIAADIAVLEADAFAAGTAGVRLPLLPASLDTLRHPLALFLDGVLGGDDQAEPFPLRGIALTGAYAPATGGRRPVFARNLLPGRAFAEAGYGRPSDAAYQQAHKRRRMAQAALAASVAGLSVAAWQGVSSVSAGSPPVAAATADLRRALLARDAVTDGPLAGRVIAATAVMERSSLATPLLPTSLVSAFDEDKKRLASVTLRRAVLRPIRDALLPSATMADLPPVANPQRVEDLPAFRRLAEQLDRIGGRRDALERYDRFRRNSGFDELNALAESVYGAVPRSPMTATDGYITRIAAGADLPNLDARTIAAAVRAESVQLAAPLAEELYGRNPLRQRAEALAERLRGLPETPTAEDVEDVRRLTGAVAEAVSWPIAGALQEPARGLPDAIRVALQKAAIADLPGRDTTDRITEALSTAATGARAAVLALDAPRTGALFAVGDGGALVLNPAVTALPDALAAALPEPAPDAPPAEAAKPAEPKREQTKTAEAKPAETKPIAPEAEPAKPVAAALPPPPRPAPEPAPPAVVEAPPVVAHLPLPPRMPVETPVPDGDVALSKLSTAFAQTLAGRFPFVGAEQARGAPDADPQDVRRFYRQLDEHRAAVMRTATPEVAAFLERMEAARPVLEAIARPSPVSVRLAYGANRAQEVGAEHIIDWSVRSGAGAVGAATNGGTLAWTPGQPVLLSARWAAGSPFRPKGASAGGTAAAAGDTITLAERGPWALLRLLKSHAPSSSRDGLLLRVALPTQTIEGQPVRDTVLVLAAVVSAGARTELPARALDLPNRFPQR